MQEIILLVVLVMLVVQAQRILEMQLQRLTGLEQRKIENEYREIMETIADLLDLLEKAMRITAVIAEELSQRTMSASFVSPNVVCPGIGICGICH